MSGSKPKFTDAQIIAALKDTHGMIYLAAQKLGADPSTIHRRTHSSARVKQAVESHRGEMIDVAEIALMTALQGKQPWAIAFTLRTIGRHRGYVERIQQEIGAAGSWRDEAKAAGMDPDRLVAKIGKLLPEGDDDTVVSPDPKQE